MQTDAERAARLRQVQDELQIEDEVLGGGRYNELEQLRRQRKKGSAVPRTEPEPAVHASDPVRHAHSQLHAWPSRR